MRVAGILMLLGGVMLVVLAVRLFRVAARTPLPVVRVCVPGVAVRQVGWSSPPRFEFEYPAPDGSRLRGIGAFGLSRAVFRRDLFLPQPGSPVSVYVDPRNPRDAQLIPPGSEGDIWRVGAIAALVVGLPLIGCGALFLVLSLMG